MQKHYHPRMEFKDNLAPTLNLITEPASNGLSQGENNNRVQTGLNSVTVQGRKKSVDKEIITVQTPD